MTTSHGRQNINNSLFYYVAELICDEVDVNEPVDGLIF
jgi:hypothetical protein